jgi:Fic family protein
VSAAPSPEWPALDYEDHQWDIDECVPISRTARRRHQGPYRAALVPQIAREQLRLPPELTATVEDAATEIARFDTEVGLEIAPFASVLLRSESAASSKIENLTATARAIAEAELGPYGRSKNAKQIVANVRAMDAAVALADRIDADAILEMHHALLVGSAPDTAGQWRNEQVWIGGSNYGPHDAVFVPPHHNHVAVAIDDLVTFIARDDIPILAHAAIAHAQFETIHPFPDGNGRTGRALLHAQLRNKRLTRHVTVPVSAGLLADTDSYFEALTAYREGDPLLIVDRVANATFTALGNGRRLVAELRDLRADWTERIGRVRRDATIWRAIEAVIRHPVINARFLADELGVAPPNVYRTIERLVEADILGEFSDRKANQLWQAPEVLAALDAFAARAARRNRASGHDNH